MTRESEKCIEFSAGYFNKFDIICSDETYVYLVCENMNCIYKIKEGDKLVKNIIVPFGIYKMCYDCTNDVFICTRKIDSNLLIIINKDGSICGDIDLKGVIEGNCINIAYYEANNCIIVLDDKNIIYLIDKCGNVVHVEKDLKIKELDDIKTCGEYIFVSNAKKIIVYDERFNLVECFDIKDSHGELFLVNFISEFEFTIFISNRDMCNLKLFKYYININKKISDKCYCDDNNYNYEDDECDVCPEILHSKGTARSLYDVIESIALQEAGLAHIINAEGEKIQKAVKICKKCSELIDINKSVQITLGKVIELESILNSKLKTVQEILEQVYIKSDEDCECDEDCNDDCNNYMCCSADEKVNI